MKIICSWCPPGHQAIIADDGQGGPASHGMCPGCARRMEAALDEELAVQARGLVEAAREEARRRVPHTEAALRRSLQLLENAIRAACRHTARRALRLGELVEALDGASYDQAVSDLVTEWEADDREHGR